MGSKKITSKEQIQSIEEDSDKEPVVPTTQSQEVTLILGAGISIPHIWLPDKLYRFLKKELNFPNPEFYAKERFGYSTWQTPRFIKTIDVNPEGITIPAGNLDRILQFINENQFRVEIVDNRTVYWSRKLRHEVTIDLKYYGPKYPKGFLSGV